MKVLIVEDELLSATHLERTLLVQYPDCKVVKCLDSVTSTIAYLKTAPALDIIFLDIHLADGISFEIFTAVDVSIPIIFTTAYDEYAIKAFKVNSIDYLLKPIDAKDLELAMEKFLLLRSQRNLPSFSYAQLDELLASTNKRYKSRFLVKSGERIASIKVDEISHFVAENGMVFLVEKSGTASAVDFTLEALEEVLDPTLFFRINRKVLIHLESIRQVYTYFNNRLKVEIPNLNVEDGVVSRERVATFKLWLDR